MDETLDIELTDAVKDVFYPALKDKLTKLLGESDSTLFEYIVLLISNKRTKSHIVNDLQAFFQDSAKDFTQWLWEFLKPFERKEGNVMQALAESDDEDAEKDLEKSKEDKRARKERADRPDRDRRRSVSPKRAKPATHNVGASRLFGNALKPSEPRESRRKREMKEPTQELEEEDMGREEKELGGIKISKVVVKKRRSRSPDGGEEGEELETRERPRARDAKRGEKRTAGRVEGKAIKAEKKGNKVSPHFTITLDGGPPKTQMAELDDDEYMMGGGTRGVVVSNPLLKPAPAEILQPEGLQALVAEPPAGLERVRCRFWPKCTNAQCPYQHPKEICPYYPNCKFGNSCMFIHVVGGRGGAGGYRARPPRGRGGFRGRGRGAAGSSSGFTGQPDGERPVGSGGNDDDGVPSRGRGRGRGAANSSIVYDAGGVVCRFDTFCEAIRCPYSHPQRDINEQNFLASSEKKKVPDTTPPAPAEAADKA